jgi:hypothetical protein
MKGRLAIFLTVALMLVILVALNAASYVKVEQQADTEFAPDRSTTNAGATGTRALYEYLLQSGHRVVRWSQPPSALQGKGAAQPSTFVIVGRVHRAFDEEEAQTLLRWVERGGRLVIIDRQPDTNLLPVSGRWHVASELFEYPGPDVRPDNTESMTQGVPIIAPAQPTPLTRDVAQVTRSRFAARLNIYTIGQAIKAYGMDKGGGAGSPPPAKASPGNDGDGDEAQQNAGRWTEDEDEPPPPPPNPVPTGATTTDRPEAEKSEASPAPIQHLPDGREGDGALLVDYAYGRGRIVVLSDPFIVSNAGINRADNLLLAANIVAAGGVIAFDEFHQGYGSEQSHALAYFAGTPVLWMFAQAGVIVLAVLWTRGRRFARPLPAPRVDRRSNLEFVASMAELQQRARAYDLAIENVYGRTRRALARYGGTSAAATRAQIAERVAARSGKDPHALEALMRECEDSIAGAPTNARRALALVSRLRELERDLGIRMRSREVRQAETL